MIFRGPFEVGGSKNEISSKIGFSTLSAFGHIYWKEMGLNGINRESPIHVAHLKKKT
jgi:hypothetical protein